MCVLGLGLIGGSILRAATAAGREAFGYNRSVEGAQAARFDGFDATTDLTKALTQAADLEALIVLAVVLAAPAYADTTDDAFIANLSTSGMNYGAPDRAILVAKTVVCGTLNDNPNTSNTDLIAKVIDATHWPMNAAAYFTGAAEQADWRVQPRRR